MSCARQAASTSGTPQAAERAARRLMMKVGPAHRLLVWEMFSSVSEAKASVMEFQWVSIEPRKAS